MGWWAEETDEFECSSFPPSLHIKVGQFDIDFYDIIYQSIVLETPDEVLSCEFKDTHILIASFSIWWNYNNRKVLKRFISYFISYFKDLVRPIDRYEWSKEYTLIGRNARLQVSAKTDFGSPAPWCHSAKLCGRTLQRTENRNPKTFDWKVQDLSNNVRIDGTRLVMSKLGVFFEDFSAISYP